MRPAENRINTIDACRDELQLCLRKLRRSLRNEGNLQHGLERHLSLWLQFNNHKYQEMLQSHLFVMGLVMILLAPVSLTTGIFSVAPEHMPFASPGANFLLIMSLFWAVIFIVIFLEQCRRWLDDNKQWRRWQGGKRSSILGIMDNDAD